MPPLDRLREVLSYNEETGKFVWVTQLSRTSPLGSEAGSNSQGYIRIGIDGFDVLAHRLAWFFVTGEWPKFHIDHINGIKNDNRFCNLRDVDRHTNMQNQRHARKHNSSGLIGALKKRGRWQAKITANGISHYLGSFETAVDAHNAYMDAKRRLHSGCTI